MITLKESLSKVLCAMVADTNGYDTDFELVESIANDLLLDRLNYKITVCSDRIQGKITTRRTKQEKANIELLGAWIYEESSKDVWYLHRFNSIEEAIRAATTFTTNVKILYNGELINWDILSDNSAFYLDNESIKVVELEA